MTSESAIGTESKLPELLNENSEYCLHCHIGTTVFKEDKEAGYYKLCLNCGHTEYLHRRFLRFNRQSRRWQ